MAPRLRFSKAERLKSRKQIDGLFATGKAFSVFPVRTIYQFVPAEAGSLQVGVTASKKYFKRAVDRNRLKRLMREAYRLQKQELFLQVMEAKKTVSVFFIYTDKTIADFETVKAAMAKSLQRLSKILQSETPS